MSLTPVEIRHVKLGRRPFGYDRRVTDDLLSDIVTSFEQVWRERADLRDKMEELESELSRQKEIEGTLRNTLLSAERMADDVRTHARREADVIISEARATARDIVSGASHDAAYVSRVAPTAMVFCPCVDGLSHNEAEDISREWAEAGANVLFHAVVETAGIVE